MGGRRGSDDYAAFVSYNHADEAMATALEHAIERFATPFWRRRRLSVFRDATSMTADDDLWSAITHPMGKASYVLFLASGHSVRARWVDRELRHCIDTKGLDHLVPVVLEGTWKWDTERGRLSSDPDALVPLALQEAYEVEPLYIDLRGVHATGRELRKDPRFHTAVAKIVSRVSGVDLETLIGEEVRQRRRAVGIGVVAGAIVSALAVLASVLAVAATAAQRRAVQNEKRAVANEQLAVANERRAVEAQAAAEAEARRNLALALATASEGQGPLDRELALALAAQADATAASPVTRAALHHALAREPRLRGRFDPSLAAGDGAIDGYTLAPNGTTAAVARVEAARQAADQLTFVDVADDFAVLGSVFAGLRPTVVFSADGRHALVSASPLCCQVVRLPDGRVITTEPSVVRVTLPADAPDVPAELATTEPLYPEPSPDATFVLSPDGRYALRTDAGNSVTLIDFDEATLLEVPLDDTPTAMTFSADGATAAVGVGAVAMLFPVDDPAAVRRVPVPTTAIVSAVPAPEGWIAALAFSPDGATLGYTMATPASFFDDIGTVDLSTGAARPRRRALTTDPVRPDTVAFSPDGVWLVAAGVDTRIFRVVDDDFGRALPGRFGGFDRAGTRLVTSGPAGATCVWPTATGAVGGLPFDVQTGEAGAASDGSTDDATFGPDADGGEQVVTAGAGLSAWTPALGPPLLATLTEAPSMVLAGAIGGGETVVGTTGGFGAGTGRATSVTTGKAGGAPSVVSPVGAGTGPAAGRRPAPGDVLVIDNVSTPGAADRGSSVLAFDASSTAPVARLTLQDRGEVALALRAVAPDRSLLATEMRPTTLIEAGQDDASRRLVVYDLAADPVVPLPIEPLETGSAVVVAFSADSRTLFVADERTVRAVAVRGEVGRTVDLFTSPVDVTALAVAPDGHLAYGTADGAVLVIPPADVASMVASTSPVESPGAAAPPHTGAVVGVWFDPTNGLLASQDSGGVVRVVDVASLAPLVEITGASDGSGVVLGEHDLFVASPYGLQRWDLTAATLQDRACAAAGRALTPIEQRRYLGDAPTTDLRCG